MKTFKLLTLFLTILLIVSPIAIMKVSHAQNPVYYSVQPVAIAPLTNRNASLNGLETPATPSPVGQFFTVTIHVIGATAANVPNGVAGVEVHFDFSNILSYATPINFTDQTGTFLSSPLFGLGPAFFDANGKKLTNATGATQYEVAAGTSSAANFADGVVVVLWFKITGQPQGTLGQPDFVAPLAIAFGDVTDGLAAEVTFSIDQGTLHIDAAPGAPTGQFTLTVNFVGNGTVTENPLSATYASGTSVTLTALSGSNWTFQGWSGDVTGVQNPVNVTMNGNKTVTATFTQPGVYYNLTVNVVGNGTITEKPFNATYLGGTVVTLTATAGFNWTFAGWTGDLVSSQNPVNLTMTADKNVTATFTFGQQYYNLTVNIVFFTNYTSFVQSGKIVENASVTETPVAALYLGGTTVTLTAVPGLNWTFWGWSGDLTGTQNQTSFTINANMNVTATFGLIWDFNHDGSVRLSDLNVFINAWKSTPNSANWNPQCDLAEPKGIISLTDLVTFSMAFWWLGA